MDPCRLDQFLAQRHSQYSRMQIKRLITEGFVKINGEQRTKPSLMIKGGEEIEILRRAPEIPKATPEDIPLDILHEDTALLVINKAPGMVVHPAPGHFHGTLVHALLHHFGRLPSADERVERPGLVHRLDKGTSGVMVIAREEGVHQALSKQFKDHTVEKIYEALAFGKVDRNFPKRGTIISSIGRDTQHRRKFSTHTRRGREAITHYEVLRSGEGVLHLQLRIETGRTHQIRVHLSEKGHPVVGDTLYGAKSYVSMIRDPAFQESVSGLERPLLHARRLSFTHPHSGERLSFEAPLPTDFLKILGEMPC